MTTLAFLALLWLLWGPVSPAALALEARPPAPPELGPGAEDIPDWKARWELAKLLAYGKRYPEALEEYRRLLGEKPDLAAAKAEMAQVLAWSGQGEEALKILDGLPSKDMDPQTRLTLADLLLNQKRYDQAEQLLREHLEASPGDLIARLKLAEMLSWQKKYQASLDEYRRILQARPDDLQVRRKYAQVLIWSGQREQAIAELRKSLPPDQAPAKPKR